MSFVRTPVACNPPTPPFLYRGSVRCLSETFRRGKVAVVGVLPRPTPAILSVPDTQVRVCPGNRGWQRVAGFHSGGLSRPRQLSKMTWNYQQAAPSLPASHMTTDADSGNSLHTHQRYFVLNNTVEHKRLPTLLHSHPVPTHRPGDGTFQDVTR